MPLKWLLLRKALLFNVIFAAMNILLVIFHQWSSVDVSDGNLSTQEKVYLLILILSSPYNETTKRDNIRKTWLTYETPLPVRHYFVIGTAGQTTESMEKLDAESKDHGNDMLFLDGLVESYQNLTLKMLTTYRKISKDRNVPRFDFLFKTDSDTFVNLPALVRRLSGEEDTNAVPQNEMLLVGYFIGNAAVFETGKWTNKDWNICDTYLPYADGSGYVLNEATFRYIIDNADDLRVMPFEDITLGVWLSSVNVRRIHELRFETHASRRVCNNHLLIKMLERPEQMTDFHEHHVKTNGSRVCFRELMNPRIYHYDFHALPRKCCIPLKT